MIDARLSSLLTKLSQYYWSERPPHKYVWKALSPGGKITLVGLGTVAMECPGTFNAVWAWHGESKLRMLKAQDALLTDFSKLVSMHRFVIDGASLADRLTLCSHEEYRSWYTQNRSQFGGYLKNYHDVVCANAEV